MAGFPLAGHIYTLDLSDYSCRIAIYVKNSFNCSQVTNAWNKLNLEVS